jgi:hypothetical protein
MNDPPELMANGATTVDDQLYRRCPECLDAESGAPCPACGGERFLSIGVGAAEVLALVERAREMRRMAESMAVRFAESRRRGGGRPGNGATDGR